MACCSSHSGLVQGALRRAFFSSGQRALLLAMLASVLLHAALLLASFPGCVPVRIHPWRELTVHLEHARTGHAGGISTPPAVRALHAFTPVKARRTEAPRTARTLPETAPVEMNATPSATTSTSSAPSAVAVAGIALPMPNAMPGRHRLWSFQTPAVPDQQMLYQAQVQRQMQLAMQASSQAARGKFETQLMAALKAVRLLASCQMILPATGEPHVSCEQEQDAKVVRDVLDGAGNPPPLPGDATWLVVELKPLRAGGAQVLAHRTSQAPETESP